jgi:tetratricopeptide (TPR) repeat protein
MEAMKNGGESEKRAREFLEEQTQLTRLEIEDLKEERKLRHWSLVVRHFSDVMKALFELAVAAIVLIILVALGSAIWSAASDSGLVIEAFSVPPDLSARGLTGQVVAAQLQDKLTSLQRQTVSARAGSSYQNNWGSDIKVQIPETGVSIGEFYNYLRQWLGHETRISGEVFHDGSGGIAVTARAGSGQGQTFRGKQSDLDTLVQKAAEAVYGQTQPYRYAVYLMNKNRNAEAAQVYTALSNSGSAHERAWAYIGLGNLSQVHGDFAGALRFAGRAIAENPDFVLGLTNQIQFENQLQHQEAVYQAALKLDRVLRDSHEEDISAVAEESTRLNNEVQIANSLNDSVRALALDREIESKPDFNNSVDNARQNDILSRAVMHDAAAVRRLEAELPPRTDLNTQLNRTLIAFVSSTLTTDWKSALALRPALEVVASKIGPIGVGVNERIVDPLTAMALAMKGDHAAASAMIAKSPLDCDNCLRIRGFVAAEQGKWSQALHWLALEAARTPSLPQSYSDWGMILLRSGNPAAAIEKLRIANAKGPHFADPLVWWGEALMAQNRSDLAAEKFASAEKYAPNWGRLHLKWGEALVYSGDEAGARKQFAISARLNLTPAESKELAQVRSAGH